MIDLPAHEKIFECYTQDSLNSLISSNEKDTILQGRPWHNNLHQFYGQIIVQNQSYRDLLNLLSPDQDLKKFYGDKTQYILFRFLDNIIIQNRRSNVDCLTFHKESFDQVFKFLKEDLYNPNWEYVAFSNLANYRSQNEIDFDTIKILGRSDDILQNLTNWDQISLDFFWKKLEDIGWSSEYIVASLTKKPKEPNNFDMSNDIDATNNLLNFITTLRLFKEGAIGVDIIYHVRKSRFFEQAGMFLSGVSGRIFGSEYKIDKSELPKLEKFWNEISEFIKNKKKNFTQISLALNRLDYCYDLTIFFRFFAK